MNPLFYKMSAKMSIPVSNSKEMSLNVKQGKHHL